MLTATFFLFCFNNLAPYSDALWQMRDIWIARLYQSIFVVFIFFIARTASIQIKPLLPIILITIILNLTICLSAILNISMGQTIIYNFYRHGTVESMSANLVKYDRRPLGFFKVS